VRTPPTRKASVMAHPLCSHREQMGELRTI